AEQAKSQTAELRGLYQLSQTISAQVDLDRILPVIAETTCRLLQVPSCAVLLYNQEGRLIELTRFGATDPRLHAIHIPIRDGPTVLGILRVSERAPGGGLRADELQLLNTLAAQTRLAVERASLVAQVAHTQALSESEQLKSALLASVTHDIRTPLAIIKAATSTLLDADVAWDTATQQSLTQTIDSEVDHLNRLVGNLLDMSRVEAGTLSSEREAHDLGDVIGATLRRLAPQLNGRTITVDLPPDLPFVSINAVLIDQVFTNLLENALKYTPAGSPLALAASCDTSHAEACCVKAMVRDHGAGVSNDRLPHIFDKFYRGEATRSAGGAGLGLAICKGIIEAHGGHIGAKNCRDGGMMFWFTLPCATPASPASE
ncbi:MAG TPA: ATP-binding protein, partial [Roseiflexaceae bacterium]|nr:ATP-binding protein [Roseiflexaceae bacterium]